MNNAVRFTSIALLGSLITFTGCATKKKTNKQIESLQAQIGTITDELARLDQQIQETRAQIQTQQTRPAGSYGAGTGAAAGGTIYRTPSGFELPSLSIQQALKNAGYYSGAVDGKIGPATRDAVKSFQRDNGLHADGVVGRQTWTKLKVYLGGSSMK